MEYRKTSVHLAPYEVETVCHYDVTGISGMPDERVRTQIRRDFKIRGYFGDAELRSYERVSDGLAKIAIKSRFLE